MIRSVQVYMRIAKNDPTQESDEKAINRDAQEIIREIMHGNISRHYTRDH